MPMPLSSNSQKQNIRKKVFSVFETQTENFLFVLITVLLFAKGAAYFAAPQQEAAAQSAAQEMTAAGGGMRIFFILILVLGAAFSAVYGAGIILERRGTALGTSFALMLIVEGVCAMFMNGRGSTPAQIHAEMSFIPLLAVPAIWILCVLVPSVTKTRYGSRILAVLLDAVLVSGDYLGWEISSFLCAAALSVTLMAFLRFQDPSPGRWLACFLLLEAGCLLLPAREEPIDWSFFVRLGNRIQEGTMKLGADTGYYLSGLGIGSSFESGYSGLGNTAGSNAANDREELYLYTGRTRENLYLTGKLHGEDFSDGGILKDTADALEGRWYFDFLCALYRAGVTREEAKLFGRVMSGEIELGYLRSQDVIIPSHILTLDQKVRRDLADDQAGYRDVKRKGYRYEVSWLSIDYGSPYLEKIMRMENASPEIPDYETLRDYSRKLYDVQLNLVVSETEYNRWKEEITPDVFTPYLSTEQYTTAQMEELAQTIAAGAQTRYDVCRAAEQFLRQYPYSRQTDLSAEENPVHAFLFQAGQGYCIHYASAMVMLLRLNGIPARFVEGYSYMFPREAKEPYAVTGSSAHAWAEAWIDGFGWVPFEPTAYRRTTLDSTWGMFLPGDTAESVREGYAGIGAGGAASAAGRAGEDGGTAGADPAADFSSMHSDVSGMEVPPVPVQAASLTPEEELAAQMEARRLRIEQGARAIRFAAMVLFGMAAYLVLMVIVMIRLRRRRYERAGKDGQLASLVRNIQWLILQIWFLRGEDPKGTKASVSAESEIPAAPVILEDYAALIPEEHDHPELREQVNEIFETYYRHRFGSHEIGIAEIREAEEICGELRARYVGRGRHAPARALRYALFAGR